MDKDGYAKIGVTIQQLSKQRRDFLALYPGNQNLSAKTSLEMIKMESHTSIRELLTFCIAEFHDTKNTAIQDIKNKLLKNFDTQDRKLLSLEKMQGLDALLDEMREYIRSQVSFSSSSAPDQRLFEPIPGEQNIPFINNQFKPLKEILCEVFKEMYITPSNYVFYLRVNHYRYISQSTIENALAEIKRLTERKYFNVMVLTNQPWLRSISFLNQLKNVLKEKLTKFGPDSQSEDPSIDDVAPPPANDPVRDSDVQKTTYKQINSGIQHRKREKYKEHQPIVSTPVPKQKALEEYLHEAEQDFITRGPNLLRRAKTRYLFILQHFAPPTDEEKKDTHILIKSINARVDELAHRSVFQEDISYFIDSIRILKDKKAATLDVDDAVRKILLIKDETLKDEVKSFIRNMSSSKKRRLTEDEVDDIKSKLENINTEIDVRESSVNPKTAPAPESPTFKPPTQKIDPKALDPKKGIQRDDFFRD